MLMGELYSRLQARHFPAFAVIAAKETVGLGDVELETRRLPFQRGVRKTGGHSSEQNSLGQGTGVIETGGGLAVAATGLRELRPMILPRQRRQRKILELRIRIKLGLGHVRQEQNAFRADEDRTLFG